MNLDRFTEKAMSVLGNAQSIALQHDHQQLTPLHLLQAFLEDGEGYASRLLNKAGIDATAVVSVVEEELNKLPQVIGGDQIYADKHFQTILANLRRNQKIGVMDLSLPIHSCMFLQIKGVRLRIFSKIKG